MAKLNNNIKASTLIEVIVALLIQVIIVSLVFSFLINNYKKTNTLYKIQAFMLLDNEIQRTIKEKEYNNDLIEYNKFKIRKRLMNNNSAKTVIMNFRIEDLNDSLLLERNRIFIVNDSLTLFANGQD